MILLKLHLFVIRLCAALAGLLLVLAALFVCVGVVSRYFFGYPLGWPTEVSGYILLYATFLAAPWILFKDAHVSIDVVAEYASTPVVRWLGVVTSAVGCVVFLVLAYWGLLATIQAYSFSHPMPSILATPRYLLLIVIPIGSMLLAVEFILRAHRFWAGTITSGGSMQSS